MVLSYRAWQTEFGGKPGVVGSTLYLEQRAFTVAGIAPPGFYGDRIAPFPPDIWLPLAIEPQMEGANSSLLQPDTAWLYAVGRLRPNVDLASLQTRLSGVLRQWMQTVPAFTDHGGAALISKQHVALSPAGGGIQKIQRQTGTGLRILMLLAGVVLLIACVNIANLLLARSMAQRREIAVRIGLGASRGRIIRQIVTESLILSIAGGAAGLTIAFLGSRAILALAFPLSKDMPVSADPSWQVLAFAFLVSLLTGLLFAAAPAWVSSNSQPAEASRATNHAARDHASIPQRLLLVLQFALSIVLLTSAFLATRSLSNLENQRTGIDTTDRYTAQLDLKGAGYAPEQLNPVYSEIESELRALPGFVSVSFARYIPLQGNEWGGCVLVQGRPTPGPTDNCFSDWDRVSPQFLDSVGAPILRGRGFSNSDKSGGLPVVLVNQAFAKRFFPNQDPLGQHFGLNGADYAGAFQVVGVFCGFQIERPAQRDAAPLSAAARAGLCGIQNPRAAGRRIELALSGSDHSSLRSCATRCRAADSDGDRESESEYTSRFRPVLSGRSGRQFQPGETARPPDRGVRISRVDSCLGRPLRSDVLSGRSTYQRDWDSHGAGSFTVGNRFAHAAHRIPAGDCRRGHRSSRQLGSRADDEAGAL